MTRGDVVPPYARNVFINCPFDEAYKPIFDAVVFAIYDCGFVPRCSLEHDDGSRPRIDRILGIIKECQLGVHDISRVQLDAENRLPRFNMPLELGLFLGIKASGDAKQTRKRCMVLDSERYRYQKFISDIAGQDIHAHGDQPAKAVSAVRTLLAANSQDKRIIPGGSAIWSRFQEFRGAFSGLLRNCRLQEDEVKFRDYSHFVSVWLREHS